MRTHWLKAKWHRPFEIHEGPGTRKFNCKDHGWRMAHPPKRRDALWIMAINRSKAVRQGMLGLVKHDVVGARYGHHDHESVPVILNFAVELRSFALQFSDRL